MPKLTSDSLYLTLLITTDGAICKKQRELLDTPNILGVQNSSVLFRLKFKLY